LALFLLALIVGALAIRVWRARPENATNRWFAAFTAAVASWVLGVGSLEAGRDLEFWGRFTFASASLIPPFFLAFINVYPKRLPGKSRGLVMIGLSFGAAFAVFSLASPLVIYDVSRTLGELTRKSGPLLFPFDVFFLCEVIAALGLLLARWRRARGLERAQLQYLVIGLVLSSVGATGTNLLLPLITGRSTYSWLGPCFLVPTVVLVGHAIVRHRLFDVRAIVHRTAGYIAVIAGLSLVLIGMGYLLEPNWLAEPVHLSFGILVVGGVTAFVLSSGVAPRIGTFVDRYSFRGKLTYDDALRNAARSFPRSEEPKELANLFRQVLRDTVVPETVTLIIQSPYSAVRERLLTEHGDGVDGSATVIEEAGWSAPGPIPAARLVASMQTEEVREDLRTLVSSGVEVWIGLGRGGQQIGVALLGPRRSGDAYFAQELDFLDALGELTSVAIETTYAHHHRVTTERERQREAQLARLAGFYAGLAHEIRTPLTTISNLVSMLPDRYDDPEYRKLMIDLVPGEVARIVALSERLRMLKPTVQFQAVALAPLLESTVRIHAQAAEAQGITILLDVPSNVPSLSGDPDNLVQLFKNLLQNALDATPQGGRIWLRVVAVGAGVCVEVVDEGTGIDVAMAGRLFEEFETTKPAGLGLGLSICRRIADAHGATLRVGSRVDGVGTRAEVVFPLVVRRADSA
jgi:signal transduction histidine kinase